MLFIKNPTMTTSPDAASTEKFKVWNREAQADNTSRNLFLLTKPLTFGNHSQRKVIQSIHFTYKSNGENYESPLSFYIKQGFEVLHNKRIETDLLKAVKINKRVKRMFFRNPEN